MTCITLAAGIRMFTGAQQEMIISTKVKKSTNETDKGVPLAPSEKDLKPWYSEKGKGRELDDMDNDMRCVQSRFLHCQSTRVSHPPLIHTGLATSIVNRTQTPSHR